MNHAQILNKKIIINDLLINYYFFLSNKKLNNKILIFIHGWGGSGKIWFKIFSELINKDHSLYFLDLPGFGQSQVPNKAYDVDDYKKIIYEFVKKLGLKKINLIGHSFGGRVTIKLASENPEFLEKVILVNSAGINTQPKIKKISSVLARIINPILKPKFMLVLRKKLYFLIGTEYLENEKTLKVVSKNLGQLLTFIKKPTLIMWGKNDQITPLYDGQLMSKLIRKSKLIVFKKAGHFCFLDQPKEFAKALSEYI